MKLVEHVVRTVDTIQSIAALYLGNADRWQDIATFNSLDYPYISTDPNFVGSVSASGTLYVTKQYPSGTITVSVGDQFAAPAQDSIPARVYTCVATTTIPAGTASGYVPVSCTVPGVWGNAPAGTITTFYAGNPALATAFSSITNQLAFTNGSIVNVKTIGDSLLVPVDDSWDGATAYTDLTDFYTQFFGEDLSIGDDGELIFDNYGGIESVVGLDNLTQAIRDRLTTPRLSLVYHPEYGSTINSIIGTGPAPYTNQWIILAITESLLADDRISNVNVVSLLVQGSSVQVAVDVTPVTKTTSERISAFIQNLPQLA